MHLGLPRTAPSIEASQLRKPPRWASKYHIHCLYRCSKVSPRTYQARKQCTQCMLHRNRLSKVGMRRNRVRIHCRYCKQYPRQLHMEQLHIALKCTLSTRCMSYCDVRHCSCRERNVLQGMYTALLHFFQTTNTAQI